MKKLSILLFLLVITSCSKKNDFTVFSGKINNAKDSVIVISGDTVFKEIKLNKDGTFSDTLTINKKGHYTINLGSDKKGVVYLDKGYNLVLTAESNPFFESFSYTGEGSATNNFILTQFALSRDLGDPTNLFVLERDLFDEKLNKLEKTIDSTNNLYANKGVDSTILNSALKISKQYLKSVSMDYERRHPSAVKERLIAEKSISKKISPKFENYTDYKGGKKSLDSYLGKYIYIDMWATWCTPCIQQIPFLKSLEKEYNGKNIEFISISTDEYRKSGGSWEAAEKKWRNFVKAKQLTGNQLWAGKDYSFQQAYQINAIPRFILIGPQGNIVDANAPRPSEPRLKEIFTSLGI